MVRKAAPGGAVNKLAAAGYVPQIAAFGIIIWAGFLMWDMNSLKERSEMREKFKLDDPESTLSAQIHNVHNKYLKKQEDY